MIQNRTQMLRFIQKEIQPQAGAEIGVQYAIFSKAILTEMPRIKLFSIDPYKHFDPKEYLDISNVPQFEQDINYETAKENLQELGLRSKLIRLTSTEAATTISNHSLDFVYLDGNHSYKGLMEDLNTWYPKIKKGGYLSGHDYINHVDAFADFEVKKAVDEFAKKHNLELQTTEKEMKSWFIKVY